MTRLQRLTIFTIRLYQRTLSPDHGWFRRPTCRYVPTCSEYAAQAVSRHGVVRGILMSARRILRCNPFVRGGFDGIS